ncbi:hypothetical protein [Rufibacter quisquiliarum]|uniref:Uncharacterized protein n=1 Tax=Rufibacter quisquiliarum TaxID=1549639 RepID=A0A839GU03_9BACT|nr:hypothetical protein [Rufibacter quisquiliarum]MBA9078945.1 hypothetical protein [Rufibacter quisquiliarum]
MKKLIQRIIAFLGLMCNEAKRFMQENVEPAVDFLAVIKKLADNPALDVLTTLTATKFDDTALASLRFWLGRAISVLDLPLECAAKATTLDGKINCYVEYLRGLPPILRNSVIAKTATVMAQLKPGIKGGLKESEIDTLVHLAVLKLKSN